jgi:hypothetical protein
MKRILTLLLLFSFSALTLAQMETYCLENRFSEDPYFDELELDEALDVVYGWAPRWPSPEIDTLRIDFHYPSADVDELSQRPFILLIHGGSFNAGTRKDMTNIAKSFARRGFVAATMSYRLGWDCSPLAGLLTCLLCANEAPKLTTAVYRSVQDTKAALRFVAHHAADYGIDPHTMFIGGISAGSVAALQTVYMDQDIGNELCPNCLDDIGPIDEGVNDLSGEYTIRGVINSCGAIGLLDALGTQPQMPVISFHDENDCVVPSNFGHALGCFGCTAFLTANGSQLIHAEKEALGSCSELNIKLGSGGHCSYNGDLLIQRSACFLKRIMCEECNTVLTVGEQPVDGCGDLFTPPTQTVVRPGELDFRCFPNPASDRVVIELKQPSASAAQVELRLFNIWGQEILRRQYSVSSTLELALPKLPKGAYVLNLVSEGMIGTQRIVIE